MKVTLINGNPDKGNIDFDAFTGDLLRTLEHKGILTTLFDLKDLHVISCTGCWGCWVKTPGDCLFKDDTEAIRKAVIHSDWVLFLSPLKMGFTSALLKKVQDKFIPLLHPYIELVDNECHHGKRYAHYPKLGLIYAPEEDTDAEDLRIVSEIYRRFAINFKGEFGLFKSIEESPKSIVNEIHMH